MENIDYLILIISDDDNFNIDYVFECKFLKQLGYSNAELMGTSLLNLIQSENGKSKDDIIKILKHNNNWVDIRIYNKNGKSIWVEIKAIRYIDENEQQKMIIKLREILKKKDLELEIEKYRKILEKDDLKIPENRFCDLNVPYSKF